jgi:lipopolysaccharide/colanic/teichoic acid biosynthesis glycosyltransferase
LWIGNRSGSDGGDCHIGPACIPDDAAHEPAAHTVFVRDIVDVTPGEPRPLARPEADDRRARRRRTYHSTKRAMDVVVSAALILTCWPLLALIALAVWIDDGRPLFFGHVRQTKGGRLFRCWKFRTMRRDAEALVEGLRAQNQCDGPQVFIEDDPRVTRVGRMLRKTNLDELPQLWNVLVGHMSLVGPRPSPDGENQFCPAWRDVRLSVRPGIAGLWQLMRRREPGEDFQEWIKYDIEYVRRASLWFDLRILWRTARMLMFGRPGHAPEHTK